jgi:hypothetical protein
MSILVQNLLSSDVRVELCEIPALKDILES